MVVSGIIVRAACGSGCPCCYFRKQNVVLLDFVSVNHVYCLKHQTTERGPKMAANKVMQGKAVKAYESKPTEEPKRLSKLGEWMEKHPKGFMIIHDMKAVMR